MVLPVVSYLIKELEYLRWWLEQGDDTCMVEGMDSRADQIDDVIGGRTIQTSADLIKACHTHIDAIA